MVMRIDRILLSVALLSTHLLNSSLVSGICLSNLCLPHNNIIENDEIDRMYMRRAIQLAARATGKTSPNPCVGCVIVLNGTVVGEGWHKKAGSAHAEVNALLMAGANAAGATAYVSLEPCNHYGRTPPCTHALIRHGVKRVIAGMVDPDPRVSGYGLQYLRDNGVVVNVADKEEEAACRSLNAPFVFRMLTERAYCIVLTSSDKGGCICDPIKQLEVTLPRSSEEIPAMSAVLQQLAPETNAIVLTSSQLLRIHHSTLTTLPEHITIAVTVSSLNEEMAAEILQVKECIQTFRTASPTRDDVEARRWLILTPGVDAPVALSGCGSCGVSTDGVTQVGDVQGRGWGQGQDKAGDVEMHCYENCIERTEEGGSPIMVESHLLLSVVKQMSILGFNAVLLLADTPQRFLDMQSSGVCQKLLIAHSNSEVGHSRVESGIEGNVIVTDSGSGRQSDLAAPAPAMDSMEGALEGASRCHLHAVSAVLSSMTAVFPTGSHPEDCPVEGATPTPHTDVTHHTQHTKHSADHGEFHTVDPRGEVEVSGGSGARINPLRVFSIRLWS